MTKHPIRLLCDSCCDLPSSLLAARQITCIPMTINLGPEAVKDGVGITAGEFYRRVQAEGLRPTTSQITPAEYSPYFREAVTDGAEAIYVGLSSALSGSVANAVLLAREPDFAGRVHVVDSLGASVGIGLMILRAADLRDAGRSAAEIVEELDAFRHRVCHLFTLDTLDFARRSGRVSNFSAIAAGILDIKPVLQVDDQGRLVPLTKVRGRKKALETLFGEMERLGASLRGRRAGVNHAAAPEVAAELAQRLTDQYGAAEVVIGEIGPTVGAHVGPGCVSIFFEGPDGRSA